MKIDHNNIRNMEIYRCRRAVMWSRFCANARRPANLTVAASALALGWFACTWVKIPLPGGNSFPWLVMVWDYSIMLLILVVSMLFSLAVLTIPPLHAKSIESGLRHIGLVDHYGFSPALISNQGLKHSNIRKLRFYTRGIAKETWTRRQSAIEDVLNVHWIDEPQYGGRRGNNRNYIVLTVAPGAENKREEPLYDDEL